MVWLAEKKVFYCILDGGTERVKIPIRVKFEFEVKEGSFVQDSMSTHVLYNKEAVQKYCPYLKSESLKNVIDKTVHKEINLYLREAGFLREKQLKN